MPIIKCAVCKVEIRVSDAQLKMMAGTMMTCGLECAAKVVTDTWEEQQELYVQLGINDPYPKPKVH